MLTCLLLKAGCYLYLFKGSVFAHYYIDIQTIVAKVYPHLSDAFSELHAQLLEHRFGNCIRLYNYYPVRLRIQYLGKVISEFSKMS